MPELILAILLTIGLAACTGLRAFTPLFLVGLFLRFGVASQLPYGHPAMAESDAVLFLLGAAAALEIMFDMIPIIDSLLQLLYIVVRPGAAVLASLAVLNPSEEYWVVAIVYGVLLAVVITLPIHLLSTGVRAASTATTAGVANPVISIKETILSVVGTVFALLFAPVAIFGLALCGYAAYRFLRRRREEEDEVVGEAIFI